MKHKAISMITRVYRFYADGFKSMTVGRYLWAMILIKLAIMNFLPQKSERGEPSLAFMFYLCISRLLRSLRGASDPELRSLLRCTWE